MFRQDERRVPRWILWTLFFLGTGLSLYAALLPPETLLRWFDIDDGFFYFKVARNFNQGLGLSFDGINRSNGFHPLWMGVCLLIYRVFPVDLVQPLRAVIILAGVINGFSALLLCRVLSRRLNLWVSFAVAGTWATWPAIYEVTTTQGMETGLSILLLLLLIERGQKWFQPSAQPRFYQALLFGVIALLAILARLDHVFYVGLVCFFALFNIRLHNRRMVYDLAGISLSVALSYLFTYKFGEVNFSNHTIFPLLYLSLLIKPGILALGGLYRGQGVRSIKGALKTLAWIAGASLALVPLLYLVNSMGIMVRFPKLVIMLELALTGIWLLLNHLVFRLRAPAEEIPAGGVFRLERRVIVTGLSILLPIAAGMGAYLAFNLKCFSTLLPVSGRVKHFWSTLDNPVYGRAGDFFDVFGIGERINPWRNETGRLQGFLEDVAARLGVHSDYSHRVIFSLSLVILIVLLVVLLARARGRVLEKLGGIYLPALFMASLLRVGFYAIYGYIGIRNWYWIVERLLLYMFIAVLLDVVVEKIGKRVILRKALVLALAGLLVYSVSQHLLYGYRNYYLPSTSTRGQSILAGTRFLERNTTEESLIGMTGGGMEGYFINGRTIVNMDGLINSEAYFRSLKEGRAAEFLAEMGVEYVYGNRYMLTVSDPYAEMFKGRLQFLGGMDEEIVLYEFKP